jgi:hypothetical protein
MKTSGLALDSIPPLFIPLRFFLTAPLFGILAALLIIYTGEEIWLNRWSPYSLSLTHLLTVGFMLMIMLGALFQFIPVISGHLIPATKTIVPIIHPLLALGGLSLSIAFISYSRLFYSLAFVSLGITAIIFSIALVRLLFSRFSNKPAVFLLRIVWLALMVTLGLGLYMLLAYSYPDLGISYRQYTNIHASWGLTGWVVLLIMAVSSQVIPMFLVTPGFSESYLKGLSITIFLTLLMLSIFSDTGILSHTSPFFDINIQLLLKFMFSLELFFFSIYTLRLISKRKRKIADITINFWYLSLSSLLLSILIYWLIPILQWGNDEQYQISLAILLIYGLAISSMMGMLQKIVPFLIYLHLQRLAMKHPSALAGLPTMKGIIKVKHSRWQYFLHLGSLMVLLLAVYLPVLTVFAGVLMLFNFLWLGYCLFSAVILYKQSRIKILAEPEMDFAI